LLMGVYYSDNAKITSLVVVWTLWACAFLDAFMSSCCTTCTIYIYKINLVYFIRFYSLYKLVSYARNTQWNWR
jgi:hypothetical protein